MLLSLDISTSITGYTILDEYGKIIKISHIDLKKLDGVFEKAEEVKKILCEIKLNYQIKSIFIESSLMLFTPGKSSAITMNTLTKFNGIVSWICYEVFEKKPQFIGATSARGKVGIKVPRGQKAKDMVIKWVQDNIPEYSFEYKKTGKIKDYCFDECDSLIIGLAGMKEVVL
jgi:hypothetical protein